jgi:hypothetical protein
LIRATMTGHHIEILYGVHRYLIDVDLRPVNTIDE